MVLKSVNAVSVGKLLGALYALLGLIIGAFFSLFSLVGMAAAQGQEGAIALVMGAGAIIVIPLFYGVLGFIGGLIMGLLYNLVASFVGGIELELVHAGEG